MLNTGPLKTGLTVLKGDCIAIAYFMLSVSQDETYWQGME